MAMTRCPGCHQRVSTLSARCLFCGTPIRGSLDHAERRRRRSRKAWLLAASLVATIIFIAGGALFLRDQARGLALDQSPMAIALMAIGLTIYLLTRLASWTNRMR